MSKWQELKKYLEDLESINPEGCEKVFNGPSGIITGLEQLLIDRFAEHLFVLTYFEMDDEALKTLIEMLNASFSIMFHTRTAPQLRYIHRDLPFPWSA